MRTLTATSPLLAVLLACSACAGAEDAALAAHRAANQVLDLKAHLGSSVASYAEIRERQYSKLAELGTARADIEANSDSHVASWTSVEENDSAAMYKVLSSVNTDEELLSSAPFRIIEPAPLFQAPQIDDKTMEEIANRLAVIAEKPSLTNRLADFAGFVIAAGKEFKKTTDAAPAAAPLNEPAALAAMGEVPRAFEHPAQSMLPGANKPIPADSLPLTTQLYLPAGSPAFAPAILEAIPTPAPGAQPAPAVDGIALPSDGTARISEESIADNAAVTDQLLNGLSTLP